MNKDDQIIYYANRFPLITRKELSELTGRNEKSLHVSLLRLVDEKRLYNWEGNGWQPHLYATYKIKARKGIFHDRITTQTGVALQKTGRLEDWHQPRVKKTDDINEDATCTVLVPGPEKMQRADRYLESDAGSETWQIEQKIRRYLRMKKDGGHFQVVFVVSVFHYNKEESESLTKGRVNDLIRMAEKYIPASDVANQKFIFFAEFSAFTKDPLGPVCRIVHESAQYSIVPNLLK
jgi:hypothetical protein